MSSDPKEIINMDLNPTTNGAPAPAMPEAPNPTKPVETPPAVETSAPVETPKKIEEPTASKLPPLPPLPKVDGNHLHPGVIGNPMPKGPILKNPFKGILTKPGQKKDVLLEQFEDPNQQEYLYNKSTIGGIDPSKLEYKETFKPKISFQKPTHTYSWIILGILLILGGALGVGYYKYPEVLSALITSIPGLPNMQSTQLVDNNTPMVINNEDKEQGLREKLLQVKPPFLLTNDLIISQLQSINASLSLADPLIAEVLSEEMLTKISAEFLQVKAVIDERSQVETTPAPATNEADVENTEEQKQAVTETSNQVAPDQTTPPPEDQQQSNAEANPPTEEAP